MYITRLDDLEPFYQYYLKEIKHNVFFSNDRETKKIWECEQEIIKGILKEIRKSKKQVAMMLNK